jgi:L-seryl-tRNA(Ser) seleniumtransferase
VNAVLSDPRLAELPHEVVVWATRVVLDEVRQGIAAGELDAIPDVVEAVDRRARVVLEGRLRPVINATGIIVHTNLGRAPWPAVAIQAAAQAAGYCNLEMELETGTRGGRLSAVATQLAQLTGAEAALVVNNNAAAVLLALTALARDREVIVSRGELVEIGGSFRIPDVIASCGARLVDVGATNRTRLADYRAAITPDSAVLLKVHRSNFRIVGFSEDTPREELVALGHERGLSVVEDLGSGSLTGTHDEPSVAAVVASGVDVVLFSGDKLLGGPQAGIAAGRADAIAAMRRNPLYRALRVDKTILAAVEATLALHAANGTTPVDEMLQVSTEELEARARSLRDKLGAVGVAGSLEADVGYLGGGALPGQGLPTTVVVVPVSDASQVASTLRNGRPAVVARVAGEALRLDPRTLSDADVDVVVARVAAAITQG